MSIRNQFSNTLRDFARNGLAYAETTNAFPAPSGGIIELADNTEYIVSQLINFGTNKLKIPDNGQVVIRAANRLTSNIQTELTGLTPFIIGDVNRLLIEDIVIDSVNDAMFLDVETVTTPFGIVTLQRSRIQNFGSLGKITTTAFQTIAMGLLNNDDGMIGNDDGFTLTDNTIISMEGTNFAAQGGDHITLKGDIGTARFFNIAAAPSAGDAFFNLDYDTITDLTVTQCPFDGSNGGTYLKATGKDQTEIATRFFGNVGAQDSYWVASYGFIDNEERTIIDSENTDTPIAGTYVDNDMERFDLDNGEAAYIGKETIKIRLEASLSISKFLQPFDRMKVSFSKNGTPLSSQGKPTDVNKRAHSFSIVSETTVSTGDVINRPVIRNIHATNNPLISDINILISNL